MAENPTTQHPPPPPPLNEAIALINSLGIKRLKLLHPDHNLMKALKNINVEVILGVPNKDIRDLTLSFDRAKQWVKDHIEPYHSYLKIRYISIGDEGVMGEEPGRLLVLPAMKNIYNALQSMNLGSLSIHVSTVVCMDVLGHWKTPLDARFQDNWTPFVSPIIEFLDQIASPIMVNVFPHIMKETRDCTAESRSLHGTNSFDAAVDALYYALKKIGYPRVPIVASSTGWPSAGGETVLTTTIDALTYNQILVRRLAERRGTRRNPKRPIDAYLFTLLNSKREPEDELEWGLYDFNMRLLYRQGFSSSLSPL